MELETWELVHGSGAEVAIADMATEICYLDSRGEYPQSSRCNMLSPLSMFERSSADPFSSNVNDLVTDALLMLAPRAQEGVKIECDLCLGQLTTAANPEDVFWLIYYVLRDHLKLMNAKICKPDARVLRIQSTASGDTVFLKFQRGSGAISVVFSEADDTCGQNELFGRENSMRRQARKIVENFGGKVGFWGAAGCPEAETCVTVELPAHRRVLA